MMGGAWLFLSAAEDPTPSPTTTTLDAGSTDTTAPASATTTTTLPSVVAEYNRQLGFRLIDVDKLLTRAQGINSVFDNTETTGFQYSAAVTALQTLADDTQVFRNTMGFLVVPEADVPEITPVHREMVATAQEMVVQAKAMVTGLKSPDTGEARKAALDAFETAVVDYKAKVDELMAFEPA